MRPGRFDWQEIEVQYVTGPDDLSIRELARQHEGAFSHFATKAREGGWEQKRKDYRAKQLVATVDAITESLAVKVAKVKTDALDVIHAAILKMGSDLADRVLPDGTVIPGQVVTPGDMAKLLDRLMPLVGQPNNINENRNIGLQLAPDLDPELVRVIADVATERGSQSGAVGRAALPGARTTGPN